MASLLSLSMFMRLLLLMLLFFVISTLPSTQPLCHDDESYALSQFKRSFSTNKNASGDPLAYPKLESWKPEGTNSDCCTWDGVECDKDTGHVIGLDLSSSYLYGSINSNSSLFRLVHLRRLNLADNHFNYSQIPSAIHHLSRLRYLNLSRAGFYGQIPLEISELSKLSSLDISLNLYYSYSLLELKNPNLRRLVQNLTSLEELQLSYVYISSVVPDILANLSSLKSLVLEGCGLQGTLPTSIFQLSNLQFLSMSYNQNLTGELPEFRGTIPLKILRLASTKVFGELPASIGNLNSLKELHIKDCKFSGMIPSSLGNMTKLTYLNLAINNFMGPIPASLANLTELNYISLSANNFSDASFSWLGKQSKLTHLEFARSKFTGDIPSSLKNLTKLQMLNIGENQLTGRIPHWLSNLTQLTVVHVENNNLHGPIPESISQLQNLELLFLSSNYLSGTVNFDIFLDMKNLKSLDLTSNSLLLLTKINTNATLPKYKFLGLGMCNLREFPDFLQYQDELESLELGGNNIHGQIPEWIWNMSRDSLWHIGLSYNSLTGIVHSSMVSQLINLEILDLSSNMLQGPTPLPSSSVTIYRVSNNTLSGDISPLICNLHSLHVLDLSNNFSGTLPQCLGNFSSSLWIMNLQNNSFHGSILQTFPQWSELRMIDLSQNQLQGGLPRSLANCTMLESLDLSDNQISDTFPFWLGNLPNLQVLDLRYNNFYGAIRNPATAFEFRMLRIIDLSHNGFTGDLPSKYFHIWNSMKFFEADPLTYMQIGVNFPMSNYTSTAYFFYAMILTKAGVELTYSKIPKIVAAIDLSSNKFSGEIPESIGNLMMLLLLNLSNNCLSGHIPSSLGNLTGIESLDLSLNNLTGEIPSRLTQFTFLEFLNVSHNHLSGPIPQGKQLDTFENSSYKGNSGLCGKPLSKMCRNSETSPPPHSTFEEDHYSSSLIDFDWMIILMGYGSGLVVGVVIGHTFTTWKHEWFMKTFGKRQPRRRRERRGHRN